MAGRRPFSELRDSLSPECRAIVREKIEAMQAAVDEGRESGISERTVDEILAAARREAGKTGN